MDCGCACWMTPPYRHTITGAQRSSALTPNARRELSAGTRSRAIAGPAADKVASDRGPTPESPFLHSSRNPAPLSPSARNHVSIARQQACRPVLRLAPAAAGLRLTPARQLSLASAPSCSCCKNQRQVADLIDRFLIFNLDRDDACIHGTTMTQQGQKLVSFCATLPRGRAARRPLPRRPTTSRSTCSRFTMSMIVSAASPSNA